jgi:hypothetical protein
MISSPAFGVGSTQLLPVYRPTSKGWVVSKVLNWDLYKAYFINREICSILGDFLEEGLTLFDLGKQHFFI